MRRQKQPIPATCTACLLIIAAAPLARSEAFVPKALDEDLQRVVIHQAPRGRFAMFGGLTRLPSGEILCVYKGGSLDPKTNSLWTVRDETIVWARSTSQGHHGPDQEQSIYQDRQTRQENCCALPEKRVRFYVAVNGNDAWSGLLPAPNGSRTDGPFASLARARDAVRQRKAAGGLSSPVTICIRSGTYRLTEAIVFTPDDSGTPEYPISYESYPGEAPVLSGARRVTAWKPDQGKILCAPLSEVKARKWRFRSLFAEGRRQIRARYPNLDPDDPYRKGFLYVGHGKERISVGCIHNVGDWMEYEVLVPAPGDYVVWARYGHGMKAFSGLGDMGGHTSITVDGGTRIPLINLPDTGTSRIHRWSRCAQVHLSAGRHTLRWRNDQGGGLDLDTFALSDDPFWTPTEAGPPLPSPGKHVVLIEAESFRAAGAPQLLFNLVGADRVRGDKTSFPCTPGTVKSTWTGAPDAELHIYPGGGCRNFKEILSIEKIDAQARRITVGGKEALINLIPGDRYFVENLREELDSPGEWHLDRKSGLLHYWPDRPGAETTVAAPVLGRMFEFRGDPAHHRPVSHVRLNGLTIQETDYSPDDGCEGSRMGKDGVVYLADAQACIVENCTFTNIGKYAICIAGGADNKVCGNDIAHGAEGGVVLLNTRRNTVSDNHIHHCGLVYKHIGGVVLEGAAAEENLVSHNRVHDMSRYGISLKESGRGNVIEFNHVSHTNLDTYDTGGIEVTQNIRELKSGSTIRYNLVHDTIGYSSIRGHGIFLAWGIYLDSFAGGYTVSHNLLYHNSYGGLFVQGGRGNKVINNILIDNGLSQFHVANFQKHITDLEFCRNIVGNRSPRVSLLWFYNAGEKVTRFERNLYFHADGSMVRFPGGLSLASWQRAGRDQVSLIGDPHFMDSIHHNYTLRPGSPAFKLGFEMIDTNKIGLVRLRCRCRHGPTLLDFAPWMAETLGTKAVAPAKVIP